MDYRSEFAEFDGVTYLNAAGQGPLPLVSARAAQAALEWKKLPHRLPESMYFGLPDRVRALLSTLMGGEPEEFAITSGASSGMAAVGANFDWKTGDEVLVGRGEFPSHFSTFMPLEEARGIRVKVLAPRNRFIAAEDYIEQITPRTRMISASLVRFDDGSRLDVASLVASCRKAKADVALLLDLSQCSCAIRIDLRELGVDFAVSSGYKWLLSPYGTGFFWARREAMEKLRPGPFYWMALEGARNFHSLPLDKLKPVEGARRWDAAETANFSNLSAMGASLEFIERVGVKAIAEHNQNLITRLIERLPRDTCMLASPSAAEKRGPYVCIAARKAERTPELFQKLCDAQIFVSLRENALRISPHLYNTERDILKLVSVLSS
ncbi:MAG TPA: aminotransferase class V-fold PLP-dependent enzyme [Candidatus Acidoferrales bacterium]|nr:aminotransferase class V-fold PLP-dependent enzyme [Candidatus Acidoferrales bacterium]